MIKKNDYRDEKGSEYIQGGKTCIQSLEEKNWQTRSKMGYKKLIREDIENAKKDQSI